MSTLRKDDVAVADPLVEGGQRFYDEHLKDELEPEHTGRYVAVEPESGRYFLTADTGDALLEAHRTLPQSLFYLARVGYPLVTKLNLPIVGREVFEMVGGRQVIASVAFADIKWLGETRTVRVIVSEDTLLGTELLDGTRLTVDYIAYTVTVGDEEN